MKTESVSRDEMSRLGEHWGWILAFGVVLILAGIFAFYYPVMSTFSLTVTLGAVLLVAGVVRTVAAIRLKDRQGTPTRILLAALSAIAGGLMLAYPGAGMLGVAIILAFYFFVGAAAQWIFAMSLRPHSGWGWGVAAAFASFALGAYILMTFPFSAIWIPGVLLGVELIISGAGLIALSFAARDVHQHDLPPAKIGSIPSQVV